MGSAADRGQNVMCARPAAEAYRRAAPGGAPPAAVDAVSLKGFGSLPFTSPDGRASCGGLGAAEVSAAANAAVSASMSSVGSGAVTGTSSSAPEARPPSREYATSLCGSGASVRKEMSEAEVRASSAASSPSANVGMEAQSSISPESGEQPSEPLRTSEVEPPAEATAVMASATMPPPGSVAGEAPSSVAACEPLTSPVAAKPLADAKSRRWRREAFVEGGQPRILNCVLVQ